MGLGTLRSAPFGEYQVDGVLHEDEKVVKYKVITASVYKNPITGYETNVCHVTVCKCCDSILKKEWV